MRVFMLLPTEGGYAQIPLDLERANVERELDKLRARAAAEAACKWPIDALIDREVEKLRDAHFEMAISEAAAPQGQIAPDSKPAIKAVQKN